MIKLNKFYYSLAITVITVFTSIVVLSIQHGKISNLNSDIELYEITVIEMEEKIVNLTTENNEKEYTIDDLESELENCQSDLEYYQNLRISIEYDDSEAEYWQQMYFQNQ